MINHGEGVPHSTQERESGAVSLHAPCEFSHPLDVTGKFCTIDRGEGVVKDKSTLCAATRSVSQP